MEILKDLNLEAARMQPRSQESEIFQHTLTYEEFRDGISSIAGFGRIAPRDLGVTAVRSSRDGRGRWLMVIKGTEKFNFPVSKKVPVGTSPKDLTFGVTIPTDEYPEVTLLGFLSTGDVEVFY